MKVRSAPLAVRAAVVATCAHAVLHLAVPPIMSLQRAGFLEELHRVYPGLQADAAGRAVRQLLLASLANHVIVAVVLVWAPASARAFFIRRPA
jgi:hypothetical protein